MMSRRPFSFAVLLGFLSGAALAGTRIETTLEPRQASIGDPLELRFTVTSDSPVKLIPPKSFGPFEVLSSTETGQTLVFQVALYDVGGSTLPASTIQYMTHDGKTHSLDTPEIPVTINPTLPPDAQDIRGNKGLIKPYTPLWIWLLILFIGMAAGAGLFWWRKRKQAQQAAAPPEPPRPAHEIALEDLNDLEANLDATAKAFYTRLSEILRHYLEARFQVPSLEKTTSEIFQEMRRSQHSPELCMTTRDVLEISDLAKFAKWEPTEEERKADVLRVRDFIVKTKLEAARP